MQRLCRRRKRQPVHPFQVDLKKCPDQGLRAAKASVSERTANRLSSLRRTYLFNPEE
jgi:hypothetical protein